MCLSYLDSNVKKYAAYKRRYGWKIFVCGREGELYFEFQNHNGSHQVLRKKWLTTSARKVSYRIRNEDTGIRKKYHLGFHIYLKQPTQYRYFENVIRKVRWRKSLALGWQDDQPVVVATQIKILEEKK